MTEPLLTRYRMLKSSDGNTWTLVGSQDAHNGDAAVKKFFGIVPDGQQVVAVTERSWRPLVRKKEVVERFVNAPVEDAVDEPASSSEESLEPAAAL